ncbi:MAG TPA: hypothetical protein VFH47_02960, partial [Candidatus Thermoplasmatota archaeon]|nr:hypothetical protein [Candidatus Thermoplasmatota archaeon]
DVDALLEKDAITRMTDEFAAFAPGIKQALIDERDAYMASHIRDAASPASPGVPQGPGSASASAPAAPAMPPTPPAPPDPTRAQAPAQGDAQPPQAAARPDPPARVAGAAAPTGGIVAVMGAGHMAGVLRHLRDGTAPPDRRALDEMPRKRIGLGTILGWGIPVAFVAFFVYLAATAQWAELREQAIVFVLVTGTFSAIGCAIALGHPLSILTAFVTAPFALLHPLVAAGWFSGLVEAKVRAPTVADFQAVKHIETMGQFWRNGVVRILMVAAMTNIGNLVAGGVVGARILQAVGGS